MIHNTGCVYGDIDTFLVSPCPASGADAAVRDVLCARTQASLPLRILFPAAMPIRPIDGSVAHLARIMILAICIPIPEAPSPPHPYASIYGPLNHCALPPPAPPPASLVLCSHFRVSPLSHALRMPSACPPHALRMACTWPPHGLRMATAWPSHGLRMASAWPPHGLRMASAWPPHARSSHLRVPRTRARCPFYSNPVGSTTPLPFGPRADMYSS